MSTPDWILGWVENIKNHNYLVIMVLLYIQNRNPKKKNQISNFQLPGSPFENLKNLNKSKNSSCLKVPDVGIQNDRIRTTITMQQTKKRSDFFSLILICLQLVKSYRLSMSICSWLSFMSRTWQVFSLKVSGRGRLVGSLSWVSEQGLQIFIFSPMYFPHKFWALNYIVGEG